MAMIFNNAFHVFAPGINSAIGRVVTSWSIFEMTLTGKLEYLQRQQAIGAAFPAKVSPVFTEQIGLLALAFKTAFGQSHPSICEKIDSLRTKAIAVSRLRNDVIHGHWMTEPDGGARLWHERGGEIYFYLVNDQDLLGLESRINGLIAQIHELFVSAMWGHTAPPEWLTSEEVSALQHFAKSIPEFPPAPPVPPLRREFVP